MDGRTICELELPAALDGIRPAVDRVVSAFAEEDAGEELCWTLRTVLREAVANAVEHGAGGDAGRPVRVVAAAAADAFRVTVEDPGSGYDPGAVPDPAAPGGRSRPRGRGLLLVRALSDDVEIARGGSSLTFVLRRP